MTPYWRRVKETPLEEQKKSYLEFLDIASDEACVRLSLSGRLGGVEAVKRTGPEKAHGRVP